jgi:hypothetical protein
MVAIPFPSTCPHCGATFDGVMGRGTSSFQTKNYQQHRDLLYGRKPSIDAISAMLAPCS